MTLDAVETIDTFDNNVLRIEAFQSTSISTMGTQTEPLNDAAATSNSSPPRARSPELPGQSAFMTSSLLKRFRTPTKRTLQRRSNIAGGNN